MTRTEPAKRQPLALPLPRAPPATPIIVVAVVAARESQRGALAVDWKRRPAPTESAARIKARMDGAAVTGHGPPGSLAAAAGLCRRGCQVYLRG